MSLYDRKGLTCLERVHKNGTDSFHIQEAYLAKSILQKWRINRMEIIQNAVVDFNAIELNIVASTLSLIFLTFNI